MSVIDRAQGLSGTLQQLQDVGRSATRGRVNYTLNREKV